MSWCWDAPATTPGGGFDSPLREGLLASGGLGADVLTGSSRVDYLVGGGGNDRIAGLANHDFLLAGSGEDSLRGGPGDDFAKTRGGGRDRLNCGSGHDIARRDASDRLQRCEAHGGFPTVIGAG
jgi:Ca2+-binding RTX toxin-like protein